MVSFDKAQAANSARADASTREITEENILELPLPEVTSEFRAQYSRPHYIFGKRLFDLIVAITALIVLFPVFVIVSILVVATSGFPAVYRQTRVGKGGKLFKIYKFRSMVKNADEILKSHPELMEEYRRTYKIANDPRISKVGHFLRSTTLDELPQLFNVIKGEMSIVGPRPIVPPELEKYGDHKHIYLYMKPGCAGLWQCSGRSDLTYDERVRLDLKYCREASLRYDLRILGRTFLAVVRRRGAA